MKPSPKRQEPAISPPHTVPPAAWNDPLKSLFLRFAASGWLPPSWFENNLPAVAERRAARGQLQLEIVSHCWQYAHLLLYQLSSLILHPPAHLQVRMTVYYCPDDTRTARLLDNIARHTVPNVTWNWQALPRERLFRRAIGRNHAALATQADWIWFTDCDLLFGAGCFDALADALQGRRDALVYPAVEYCTPLLDSSHSLLQADPDAFTVTGFDAAQFSAFPRSRATGPLQITHGDVARACGYCNALAFYQKPAASWCKAHEDRAFRWLLRSQGVALDIPGVFRIRHAAKGRYAENSAVSRVRGWIRRTVAALRESRGS